MLGKYVVNEIPINVKNESCFSLYIYICFNIYFYGFTTKSMTHIICYINEIYKFYLCFMSKNSCFIKCNVLYFICFILKFYYFFLIRLCGTKKYFSNRKNKITFTLNNMLPYLFPIE